MNKSNITFKTEIQESQIRSILEKNYPNIITDYFELQRGWLARAYQTFNDLDKYFILISIVAKTFNAYKDYFIKLSFDEFYNQKEYELKKFNIVDIAKQLHISKETARRKILELEKQGIIKKDKKNLSIQRGVYELQKPTDSIVAISRFLSSISKKLKEAKIIDNHVETNDFVELIKKNYTVCWNVFLNFQILVLTDAKAKFFGDYETFQCFGMIIYNSNLHLNQKLKGMKNYEEIENLQSRISANLADELAGLTESIGLNAMTVSDLTGIPRPTVIRKLNKLVKTKFIVKGKNNLYSVAASQSMKNMDSYRKMNVGRIASMITNMFNSARMIGGKN